MSIIQSLMPGVPTAISQTTSYALPSRGVFIMATVACELSADGTTFVTQAATTTGVGVTGAAFVRCTTSTTCVVIVKLY